MPKKPLYLSVFSIMWSTIGLAQDKIAIHYNERPPYLMAAMDGEVKGLTGSPASEAFSQANIPHYWTKTPAIRQLKILKHDATKNCLVGWFKNPQREKYAKFTKPIYRDKPTIALTSKENKRLESGSSVESTFNNKRIVLLVKKGYSYGPYIDSLIEKLAPRKLGVVSENQTMINILTQAKSHYMFMAEDEAVGLLDRNPDIKDKLKYIRFNDMPLGNYRYILCSQQVEDTVIEKLNGWIEKNVTVDTISDIRLD